MASVLIVNSISLIRCFFLLNEWMNEWGIYIALYCVLLYTQSALQSCVQSCCYQIHSKDKRSKERKLQVFSNCVSEWFSVSVHTFKLSVLLCRLLCRGLLLKQRASKHSTPPTQSPNKHTCTKHTHTQIQPESVQRFSMQSTLSGKSQDCMMTAQSTGQPDSQ